MIIGPNIVTDGLVLALDAGNVKSFRGESTVNVMTSPINMGSGRSTTANIVGIFTDFTDGGFNNCPFVRITRTGTTPPAGPWDFQFLNSNPGYPNGTLHTFSFYARSVDGSTPTIKMSNPDSESQIFNLTKEWKRYEATFTIGAQISGHLYLRINRSNQTLVVGSNYDICMGQIEYKSYSTPFVEGTRGSTPETGGGWLDLSGSGGNSSLVNSPLFESSSVKSISFNGTNNYIQTPLNGTYSQITFDFVSFFEDPTLSTTSRNESVFGDWVGNKVHFGSRWSVGMHWNVNNQWVNIPNTNLKYGWNYYCLTYDVSTNSKKVYINGILSSTQTTNGNLSFTDFRIGVATNLNAYYRGNLSFFNIYNRALTQVEILKNYNSIKTKYNI